MAVSSRSVVKLVVEGQKASASYWGFSSPPGYGHSPAGDLRRPAIAQNPPNALVSHSSLGPHGEGHVLQGGQRGQWIPWVASWQRMHRLAGGASLPGLAQARGRERGFWGRWRHWGLTLDFALASPPAAEGILRGKLEVASGMGVGCGKPPVATA